MKQKIFFSYSRTDGAAFVLKLAPDLKKEGFNVWVDQLDIRAGAEWDLEVEKALESCDCLLFIETEKSVNSNNVLDEVYYALGQNKKVIPLIVRDSKTPFRLQRLQHIDFSKDYDSGLTHLIRQLRAADTPEVLQPAEAAALPKIEKPFYVKHARLILIISSLLIIITAAIIYTTNVYTVKNAETSPAKKEKIINTKDSLPGEEELVVEPNTATEKNAINENPVKQKVKIDGRNKILKESNNKTTREKEKTVNLNENFAGDWQLVDVDPKAQSVNGYLKIEVIPGEKVNIKSYFQFYYFKTNDTSFLSIFNGFAGCSNCVLEKEMKITAEDIAIGSHTYKILKQDEPGVGKAGDTIMDAGSNKSIRASVTLHLINNKTVVIKVQRAVVTELAYGLIVQPFVYSFSFKKSD